MPLDPNALSEYLRKRSLDNTPEPGAEDRAHRTLPANVYCVQRHHASRLHYDLRIEVGGTLKSWAVPQGPTLDPDIKRLAVMVEDHPLMYATFEGNIPKGNYGAGSMMLWDFGAFETLGEMAAEGQIERGDWKFRLSGIKLQGDFALVRTKRGKGNEWLLLKKKGPGAVPGWDTEGHAVSVASGRTQAEIAANLPARTEPMKLEGATKSAMPTTITPMLASLAETPPLGGDWVYEIKWDGVRALAFVENGAVRFVGRKGTPIDRQYPELSVLPHSLKAQSAILDGEIAAIDETGRPSFERLQPRIMASDPNAIASMARSRPVIFFAFDLLYLDGEDLRGVALEDRKRKLSEVLTPSGIAAVSEHFTTDPKALLDAARTRGFEGIVAKRLSSRYQPTRSKEWVKVKINHEQDFVLCGYTKGERDYFGALVLGVYDPQPAPDGNRGISPGKLKYAGNVGTGFDRKLMELIHSKLKPLETSEPQVEIVPKLPQPITWTRPELVATVKYLEWTSEGRLRAPVFVGLRNDIDPRECVREGASEPEPQPALLPPGQAEASVTIEGHTMRFKNLNKVFYPREGYTKGDLINYYYAVADWLLPHWTGRPLSLRRYPDGIEGEGFFQKNAATGFPDWVRVETIMAESHEERVQVIGDGGALLIYMANLGCIDQNPWMSHVETLDNPDFVLIDLDPSECSYDRIVEAAQYVRRKLDLLELTGYPKTTGGDGMHVYVPLEPVYSYEQSRGLAEILARIVAAERPDLFTMPRSVNKREKGKVYFDYMQNARGKTISAPYVPRAYAGAPVATPLEWREVVAGLRPGSFHIGNAMERFARVGDLFRGVLENRQKLEGAIERLEKLM